MAFKTKSNKFAFVKGLIAGAKGKKPFKYSKKPKKNTTKVKAKPKKTKCVEFNSYSEWEKHFYDTFFNDDDLILGNEAQIYFDALKRSGQVVFKDGKILIGH